MSLACAPSAPSEGPLVFWHPNTPSSADPLDADQIHHSIAFGPLHSTLVDRGRKGELLGGLAESWRSSADFTEWSFVFRAGTTYETGEAVRPEHLAASWGRLRAKMAARGSKHPLFDRLRPERPMTVDGRTLTLRFKEPFPKLLNHVSDEILGLVHPSCLAAGSGGWACGRKPVSSGPYRLTAWDESGVTLRLRDDFPAERRHPRAFGEVRIVSDPNLRASADVVYSLSREDHPPGAKFVGGMDSAIAYARCQSWSKKGSPCADRAARSALRDRFYAELSASGFAVPRTFFPPSIPGISPLAAPAGPGASVRVGEVAFDPVGGRAAFLAPADDALERAVSSLGGRAVRRPVPTGRRFAELAPGLARYENDLAFFMVEITLEDPKASVRFMFESAEGVRLPDPTGRILAELRLPKPDLQTVNARLWDDAIIWPVAHAGFGVWVGARTDASLTNDARVATPLAWLGRAD